MWQKKEKAKAILQKKKLRLSNPRIELLSFFIHHPNGHDHAAIQDALSFNRVTIYRTLNTFIEHGILTKINALSGKSYYIFHHHQNTRHPHLKCKKCNAIFCLPKLPESYLEKLKSFQIEELHVMLEGVCENCIDQQPD